MPESTKGRVFSNLGRVLGPGSQPRHAQRKGVRAGAVDVVMRSALRSRGRAQEPKAKAAELPNAIRLASISGLSFLEHS